MTPVTLYSYGVVAWLWRLLIAVAMLGGVGSLVGGAMMGEMALLFGGIALLAPAIYFGSVVAVRIDQLDDDFVQVETLLIRNRRLARAQFGRPRVRTTYEDESATLYAPRVWVPVRGQWPVYVDLLGVIPDRGRFFKAMGATTGGWSNASNTY